MAEQANDDNKEVVKDADTGSQNADDQNKDGGDNKEEDDTSDVWEDPKFFDNDDTPPAKPAKSTKDDDDEDEDDDGLSADDKKAFGKLADGKLSPIEQRQRKLEVRGEVADFFSSDEAAAFNQLKNVGEFKKKLTEAALGSNVKVPALAYALAGKNLLKMGARMAKKADEDAAKDSNGGTPVRQGSGGNAVPDFNKMSRKEIEDYSLKVKRGLATQ